MTEEVNGVDLVEWMVRQAAGEMPPLDQASIKPSGASIQVRLYAEDPGRDFRPSSGLLTHVAWPKDTRIETWVESGSEVSPFYDPMLAKIIVTGATRDEALSKLQAALDATEIGGLETNLDYLRQLSRLDVLARGEMLTRTLQDVRLPGRHHRGRRPRHADHDPGLAGARRLLGGRRAALGSDGSALVPARQPARRQCRGRRRNRDHARWPDAQVQQRRARLSRRRRAHRDARRRARALLAGVRRQGRAGAEARRRDWTRHACLYRRARRHRCAQISRQPLDLHARQVWRPWRPHAPRRRCAAYRRSTRRRGEDGGARWRIAAATRPMRGTSACSTVRTARRIFSRPTTSTHSSPPIGRSTTIPIRPASA